MLTAVGVPAALCRLALRARARCRRASHAATAKKEMAVLLMVAALAVAILKVVAAVGVGVVFGGQPRGWQLHSDHSATSSRLTCASSRPR